MGAMLSSGARLSNCVGARQDDGPANKEDPRFWDLDDYREILSPESKDRIQRFEELWDREIRFHAMDVLQTVNWKAYKNWDKLKDNNFMAALPEFRFINHN